ncbi:MAG: hypothetical protein U1D97_05265 [Desulfuromonadales bacterium]|nr:hypothetical protein [Desulfuromonadales bacterium]
MPRISLLFLLLLFLMPMSAYSAVGVSLELGGGSGNFDENAIIFDTDVDTGYANIGFVYDSNPYAEYGNFSYRLNIALESHDYKDRGVTLETGALVFDNIFAFILTKSDTATFWIGPQIRVGFMSGETDDFDPLEVDGAMFGLGAVVGTNIRTASNVGMSLSAGVRRTALTGEMSEGWFSDDFTGDTNEAFVNLALLFN